MTHEAADLTSTLPLLDRHEAGLSFQNIGAWERPRQDSGLIPSHAIQGFLMGQPDLLDALTPWALERFPMRGRGEPYTALLLLNASPGDMRAYAKDRDAGKRASLLIDCRFLFGFGYRSGSMHERYTNEMIGGLLIRRQPEGAFEFSTHT